MTATDAARRLPWLDVNCHAIPPRLACHLEQMTTRLPHMMQRALRLHGMVSLDERLECVAAFPRYRQVPSLTSPPVETFLAPREADELARLANDEMAAFTSDHPEAFRGFIATLTPAAGEAALLAEASRATEQLGALGLQVHVGHELPPIDAPVFRPLLEWLDEQGVPLFLHPWRSHAIPDHAGEGFSLNEIWWALGWPVETTTAMLRLVLSGTMDRHPRLRVVTHHAGGVAPMVAGRVESGLALRGNRTPGEVADPAKDPGAPPSLAAFRRFHADTATFGSPIAIEAALRHFGPASIVFATDFPFGCGGAQHSVPRAIEDALATCGDGDLLADVAHRNAERLLGLSPISKDIATT